MKTITTKCIILGHGNIGEADKIVYFYSEDLGKINVMAKGARKITSKFTGHLETLNICTVSLYFGPKNTILTEIITQKNPAGKQQNLKKISASLKIAEITQHTVYENQKIDKLIKLMEETLSQFKKPDKEFLFITIFTIKLLNRMGIIPDFKATSHSVPQKYQKFMEFIKTNPLKNCENIRLTGPEENYMKNLLQRILENETNRNWRLSV